MKLKCYATRVLAVFMIAGNDGAVADFRVNCWCPGDSLKNDGWFAGLAPVS